MSSSPLCCLLADAAGLAVQCVGCALRESRRFCGSVYLSDRCDSCTGSNVARRRFAVVFRRSVAHHQNESSSLKLRFLARELSKLALHPCFRRDRGNLNFGQNPIENAPRLCLAARPIAIKQSQCSPTLAKALPRPLVRCANESPATDSPGHHDQTDTPPRRGDTGVSRTRDKTENHRT